MSSPIGGEDWTGGSVHSILWAVSDPDSATVTYWINVSSNDGVTWARISNGTIVPSASTRFLSWTVPTLNSTLMRVRLCAADNLTAVCTTSGRFTVDSARPFATPSPANGQTGVSIRAAVRLNFSEAMQTIPPALTAVVFVPSVSLTSITWTSPAQLNVTHADFAFSTSYAWYVDCSIRDASSPGNPVAGCGSPMWSFTTAAAVPPTVALLSPTGGAGGADWTGGSLHDILWSVSDPDTPVVDTWINASSDNGSSWSALRSGNVTADGSNRSLPWTVPVLDTLVMRIQVCASDRSFVICATSLAFTVDSTPPGVVPSPGSGLDSVSPSAVVRLDFSESMQTSPPALTAVAFAPGVAVLSLTWTTPFQLLVTHADFAPGTNYTWTVDCSLRDASNPGNALPGCGLPLASFRTNSPPSAVSLGIDGRSALPETVRIPSDAPPAFSWTFQDPDANASQAAFEWQVLGGAPTAVISDSGLVISSTNVSTYRGPSLVPGSCYVFRVRLFDGVAWSSWGQLGFCLAGLSAVAPPGLVNLPTIILGSIAAVVVSGLIVLISPRWYRVPEVVAVAEAVLALLVDVSMIVPSLQPLRLDLSPGFLVAAVLTVLPVVVHFLPESGGSPLDPGPGVKLVSDGLLGSAMVGLGLAFPPAAPVVALSVAATSGLGLSTAGRWRLGKAGAMAA